MDKLQQAAPKKIKSRKMSAAKRAFFTAKLRETLAAKKAAAALNGTPTDVRGKYKSKVARAITNLANHEQHAGPTYNSVAERKLAAIRAILEIN